GVRATLARRFWRGVAARFADAAAILRKLLGRAVYGTNDRVRARPQRNQASAGGFGSGRAGLRGIEKETCAQSVATDLTVAVPPSVRKASGFPLAPKAL